MELLQSPIEVLCVLLFWATVVFIGWSLTRYILSVTKDSFVYNWRKLPLAGQFVIVTAVSFSLFGLFTVIAYILRLPSWCLSTFYIASLIGACTYTGFEIREQGIKTVLNVQQLQRSIQNIRLISPLSIMIILCAGELLLSLFIGGYMAGDGMVHVSKIRHLAEHGFTFTDAYYGTVPETRHVIAVLHTLMATPTSLGFSPITTWYASMVFYKLVFFFTIFYFAWRLLYWAPAKLRSQYAALGVVLALAMFSNYFLSYPANFVVVWVMLLLTALFDVVKGRSYWLLIISSFLITLTHPLAGAACALFLILLGILMLLFSRKTVTWKFFITTASSALILLSTPLFALTLPNRMTDAARNLGAVDFAYYRFGSHIVFLPTQMQYFSYHGLFTTLVFALAWGGIIGLFIHLKDKQYRITLAAILLFVPLLLYNPITFIPLLKALPAWAISRFTVVNQLTVLLPLFGLLFVVYLAKKVLKTRVSDGAYLSLVMVAVVVIFGLTQSIGLVDPADKIKASMYKHQRGNYLELDAVSAALPQVKDSIILASRMSDNYVIPVVSQFRVVAIGEANATPAADMVHREACYELLLKAPDAALLKQANVSYVLASSGDVEFAQRASTSPYLTVVKSTDTRTLYKFDGSTIEPSQNPACTFNE